MVFYMFWFGYFYDYTIACWQHVSMMYIYIYVCMGINNSIESCEWCSKYINIKPGFIIWDTSCLYVKMLFTIFIWWLMVYGTNNHIWYLIIHVYIENTCREKKLSNSVFFLLQCRLHRWRFCTDLSLNSEVVSPRRTYSQPPPSPPPPYPSSESLSPRSHRDWCCITARWLRSRRRLRRRSRRPSTTAPRTLRARPTASAWTRPPWRTLSRSRCESSRPRWA